ncbi:MAG TPA: RICIN domain-containing protein [Streptosporangiaceae bacterium]
MLDSQAGLLLFTAALDPGTQHTLERWTADKMSDGSYIYIFVPSGQCLTASAHNLAAVFLAKCDLGVTQRWHRVQLGFLSTGLYYWELRSQLNGRCLANSGGPLNGTSSQHAARLEPCDKSRPAGQLIRMQIAY